MSVVAETEPSKDVSIPSSTEDSNLDRRTLFVRSIPLDATNEELNDHFSQFAPVRHAVIVYDNEKKSRGFGFVSFVQDEDALIALKDSKTKKFKDKLLRVDVAKRRERKDKNGGTSTQFKKPEIQAQEVTLKKSAKLIIRNLPWSIRDSEELKTIFSKFGSVKEAHIPRKKGGRMTGFAFVTMNSHSTAEKTIKQCNELKIHDREVAVDFAIDKSRWEDYKQQATETKKEEPSEAEDANDSDESEAAEEDEESVDDDDEDTPDNVDEDIEDNEDDDEEDDDEDVNADADDEVVDMDLDAAQENREKKNKQESFSIFVRNVPYDATRETLEEHFSKFGPIKYALPVMDKETGLSKGSAFVAFHKSSDYEDCLLNAPEVNPNSMLIPDDVSPLYVYEGRILQVSATVDRDSAAKLAEKNADARKELLGRTPSERDRRHLFLLNEGRITADSKLASVISKSDLDIREKSYNLRVQQLNKNPTLHLSYTRLAIRNLPRSMNEKALKALGRKAVVEFAKEVKAGARQPLSKEENIRSTKHQHFIQEKLGLTDEQREKQKKPGLVKQAKIINEIKDSGEHGRSRGYGFLEFRDHRSALMALRWMNAHEVTIAEIVDGLTDDQRKVAEAEGLIHKRRLIVEFAIENAKVIQRRNEQLILSRNQDLKQKRKRAAAQDGDDDSESSNKRARVENDGDEKKQENKKRGNMKGNMNKGPKGNYAGPSRSVRDDKDRKPFNGGGRGGNRDYKDRKPFNGNNRGDRSRDRPQGQGRDRPQRGDGGKSGMSSDTKRLIGIKRKRKQGKK
ncbi:hypothetical protein CANARDRAFT_26434 [[Candida] arabinofermentans NRRL YB-2248]|uniref:RRM domain-containing protein n=1 Tax=[Candida] arabinofermentans NRRL YB-2248 TaxID=983967 RepID=A0A1E4T922_9ASCO|nr:hypothetical protein CANARDRAFT_26434 [[Candida] arabinofermentans NRRL YB-2248]